MISSYPEHIQKAYDECRRIALGHYENFPVGSVLIPKDIRPDFFALYAFMRTADDFADVPSRTTPERLHELANWRLQLALAFNPNTRDEELHPIFQALRYTVKRHGLTIQPFSRLLDAFEFDAKGEVHFATFDDLLWYCDRSANPVGELVLALSGYRDRQRISQSNDICTALQLLNFCQDIREDVENERYYFALNELRGMGIHDTTLLHDHVYARHAVMLQLTHVKRLLESGTPLTEQVGGRLRYELRAVVFAARAMIRKIVAIEGNSFVTRPKLSKLEHVAVLVKSLVMKP